MHQGFKHAGPDRPGRQAGELLLPAAATTTSTTTSPTRSWAWSRARRRTRSATAWRTGTRATTASSICRGPTACKRGTGWLIPPGVLHAPGSLCTYEPQWGTDVFGMFQSLVEGREVPWSLLVKDMPQGEAPGPRLHHRASSTGRRTSTRTSRSTTTWSRSSTRARSGNGYTDSWIVYGTVDGEQLFSAKELTLEPGAKCTLKDPGASGWITVQGRGRIGKLDLQTPAMIRFGADDRGRSVHHARSGHGAASKSRTPAASRSSACATSAPTCTRTCRRSAIIVNVSMINHNDTTSTTIRLVAIRGPSCRLVSSVVHNL